MEPKPRWRRLLRLRCDKKLRGAGPAVPRVSARAAMREALGPTETFEPPPLPCGRGWDRRFYGGLGIQKRTASYWDWGLVQCLFQGTISSEAKHAAEYGPRKDSLSHQQEWK
jgi:hypothetical protein